MTLTVGRGGRYDRLMAMSATLAKIQADHQRVADEFEQGGAMLVLSDEVDNYLGVLTRDPTVLGDAEQVEAERLPPLEQLPVDPGVDQTQPAS
jgi:hypothetical protein